MLRELFRLVMNHFRLGYTRAILTVDLVLSLLMLIDLAGYWIYTGSFRQVIYALTCLSCGTGGPEQPGDVGSVATVRSLMIFASFMIVILPLLLGVLHVVSRRPTRHMDVARKPVRVLCVHLAFCAAFIYFFFAAAAMRNLSGIGLQGDIYSYGLSPLVYRIITLDVFRWFLLSLVSLVSSAVSLVVLSVLVGRELPPLLKHYMVRADLADLPSELRPLHGEEHASPRIAFVWARVRELRRRYSLLASQPAKSAEWLDREWESCQQLTQEILLKAPAGKGALPNLCEFFTQSGSALDAALAEVPRPRLIIIDPYAGPHLRQFLNWRAVEGGDTIEPLAFEPDDYSRDWAAQEAKIVEAAQTALRSRDGHPFIVISEVAYATGRRLILRELLERLKNAPESRDIQVLVDGTNAVGNRGMVPIDLAWDYYIFAPHRWLLALDPCEILLSRKARTSRATPPGIWVKGAPKTEREAATVMGLHAALELLDKYGLEYFWSRSERLCQESRLGLPEKVQIVGENSGTLETFVLSCCPRPGSFWRLEPEEIENLLAKNLLPASVLRLDPKRPWVRISIPYYSDFQDLRRICEFLGEMAR